MAADPNHGRAAICAKILIAAALLSTAVLMAGCGKKTRASAAPPAPSIRAEPPAAAPASAEAWEPQIRVKLPPPQPVPQEAIPPAPVAEGAVSEAPPARTAQRPAVSGAPEPAPSPAESPPEPASPPPAAPQLGQILTESQRRDYNRLIDASVEAAHRNLALVLSRPLSSEQSAAVKRIRAFLRQSDEARSRDLALAKNLADRARLLAEDLARTLR